MTQRTLLSMNATTDAVLAVLQLSDALVTQGLNSAVDSQVWVSYCDCLSGGEAMVILILSTTCSSVRPSHSWSMPCCSHSSLLYLPQF